MPFEHLAEFQLGTLSDGHCPDCGGRGYLNGPKQAGTMVDTINIECADVLCRARFNITFFSGRAIMGARLPRRSEGGVEWPSEPKARGHAS